MPRPHSLLSRALLLTAGLALLFTAANCNSTRTTRAERLAVASETFHGTLDNSQAEIVRAQTASDANPNPPIDLAPRIDTAQAMVDSLRAEIDAPHFDPGQPFLDRMGEVIEVTADLFVYAETGY